MSSKRGRNATRPKGETSSLMEALKYVSMGQKPKGEVYQTHCAIWNGHVMALDGVLTVGHKIAAEITACPNTAKFIDALSKCETELAITQPDEHKLTIKSGRYSANVPCVPWATIPESWPNPPTVEVSDKVKTALCNAGAFIEEGAQRVHCAAALLQSGTAVGTDGKILFEQFHGANIGAQLLIPKRAIDALAKSNKTLAKIGFSDSSVTFWNEDDSFIKSQIYNEQYVQYAALFNGADKSPWPIPQGLFEAIRKVESFSDSGQVFFRGGKVHSHPYDGQGASFEVDALTNDMSFASERILQVEAFTEFAQFDVQKARMFFYSTDIRGILMGCLLKV